MSTRGSVRHLLAVMSAALVAMVGLVVAPGSAEAHTELDYSVPTDGATIGMPVDEITVAFTLPVTLVGNGFAVLDPQNNELEPFAVTDDDTVFRLQFDPPLAGGTVAVKYEVRAEDGHVLTGNFVFVVDAAPPTTAPPTTVPPPSVSPTSAPAPTRPTTIPTTSPAPTSDASPATTTATAPPSTASSAPASDAASISAASVTATDDDGGSGSGVVIAIVAAVALAAAAVLIVRSRTPA